VRISPEQLETKGMTEILRHAVRKHPRGRLVELQNYYEGTHDILSRQMYDSTKPNNKLVNNLAAYITDTVTGYFMGMPVVYSADGDEEDKYVEALTDIFDYNNEQDHNAELAKGQSVKGVGYELLYIDEEAKVRIIDVPAENVIYIETNEVEPEPVMAVRTYEEEEYGTDAKTNYYEVYTDSEIIVYKTDEIEGNTFIEIARQEHYFGEVPVIQYQNNKEKLGDFEGVKSLIDAYNRTQSDTANDFEYFTDAYLKLTGAKLDDDDLIAMREKRVIGLPDKECDADWLIKTINDTAVENYKNRLRKDIHALAKTPNLVDEQFGGQLSGVAIAYKIWGMDQIVAVKERKFKRGLQRRIKLITNILNMSGNKWNWRDIHITFSRNMPQNLSELAEMVGKLKGIVSDETLLAMLPFVDDPAMEIERLEEAAPEVNLDEVVIPEEIDEPAVE
jgi:SPP1 family phage portal protein